ncbi:unnamed protein product [Nippostrongylus brasiliensis]|uniref:Reverse transcriptase domain-containing protein n=1 Tax=Nippostrongylus brasiliensis TaxID=27835 RepID=A0A0N4XXK3_NIPBR|nr:unnamed protein product [Nippostrongylus brasiliensis]
MSTNTIHGNSQFQKPASRRWTWESPGGLHHNEIDHVIVNRRFCLTDVAVVPKFFTGSDHRLLRASFCLTRRQEKAMKFKKRGPRTLVNWDLFSSLASCWKDSAEDNIDEEYNRLIAHIRDCAQEAESPKYTRKRLFHETLELIRQRGVARTEGDYLRTSELAKLCREAIKEDLEERRVAALVDAAEAGKSIRNARRGLINYKTKMTALLRPDGTLTSSRRAMEKVIDDWHYSKFLNSRGRENFFTETLHRGFRGSEHDGAIRFSIGRRIL